VSIPKQHALVVTMTTTLSSIIVHLSWVL